MFSRHTAWSTEPSPLDLALARSDRSTLLDLTISNPTRVGLTHPAALYTDLHDERSALYDPASLGIPSAREAVADYYAERGRRPDPANIGLCASSSEAYSHLLALLCDPGDAVLVPQPGYPLLRVLAELAHVELVPYPLLYDGTWSIDQVSLTEILAATPRARALVVVAPNNPTGNYLHPHELPFLDALLAPRQIALLTDEVFFDYPLRPTPRPSPALTPLATLAFTISGLSKVAALPQLKLAWWLATGPAPLVHQAIARLELIADTYLSVATPVQLALPRLLAAAPAIQAQISARTRHNLATLRAACRDTALTVLDLDAGWTALLRLPAVHDLDDEAWALQLLARARILTQPGNLYDLHDPPHLAVSLLTPESTLAAACDRLRAVVAEVLASGPCCP
jgi:alanine-synthesizing transaminase